MPGAPLSRCPHAHNSDSLIMIRIPLPLRLMPEIGRGILLLSLCVPVAGRHCYVMDKLLAGGNVSSFNLKHEHGVGTDASLRVAVNTVGEVAWDVEDILATLLHH